MGVITSRALEQQQLKRKKSGAGATREQVAGERVTCRGYYSLLFSFVAILLVITLQISSGYMYFFLEYLGGPTFKWDGPIFEREGSRKSAHPPL